MLPWICLSLNHLITFAEKQPDPTAQTTWGYVSMTKEMEGKEAMAKLNSRPPFWLNIRESRDSANPETNQDQEFFNTVVRKLNPLGLRPPDNNGQDGEQNRKKNVSLA